MKIKKIENKIAIKYIKYILFIIALILIYLLSPKITAYIQFISKFLYDLESSYITRVVELILAANLIFVAKSTDKEEK